MKKLGILSFAIAACVMLSACGAKNAAREDGLAVGNTAVLMDKSEGIYYSAPMSGSAELESKEYAFAGSNMVSDNKAFAQSQTIREEKLVYTSHVTLETEDFDTATDSLHATVKSLGGIIISENAQNLNNVNSHGYRNLYMTVRIPQENYDTFLSGLSENYNVANVQNSVDNLTEHYYDNENRLKSYRIQEERLFAMLEKAENVSEMLEIEARLCDVQYEIEALTNANKTIDNDVKYSTFHLTLNEVTKFTTPAPKTFGDRLGETLSDSGEAFVNFLEDALFVIIFIAPYLVIFAIAFIIGFAIIKRKKRKTVKEDDKNEK